MDIQDLLSAQAGDDGQNKPVESPLKSLKKDLDFYRASIQEVAADIIAEGLSEYPIFVAHQHEVNLGEVILDKEELGTEWTIAASTLAEFVQRGVIKDALKARFIKNYKNPNTHMCLFVVVPEGANFVFYPYQVDDKS